MDTVNELIKICVTLAVKGAISPRPPVVFFSRGERDNQVESLPEIATARSNLFH
jgi:hypothetical protein